MKFITLKDYYAKAQKQKEWILEPFGVAGSLIMIYGRQGLGKSTLAWQMAHSLTTGEPFLGFTPQKTGPVIYLQLDMPDGEFALLQERTARGGCSLENPIHLKDVSEDYEDLEDDVDDMKCKYASSVCGKIGMNYYFMKDDIEVVCCLKDQSEFCIEEPDSEDVIKEITC